MFDGLINEWKTPRAEQIKAFHAVNSTNKSGFCTLPCGFGKTVMLALFALQKKRGKVLVVAGNRNATVQLYTQLYANTVLGSRLFLLTEAPRGKTDKVRTVPDDAVVIISYDLLHKRDFSCPDKNTLEFLQHYLLLEFELILLDEVHTAMGDGRSGKGRLNAWKAIRDSGGKTRRVIGVSATPYRAIAHELRTVTRVKDLTAFLQPLGPCLYREKWRKMEEQKIIAKLLWTVVSVPRNNQTTGRSHREQKDLDAFSGPKLQPLRDLLNRHTSEKGLIFVDKLTPTDIIDKLNDLGWPELERCGKLIGHSTRGVGSDAIAHSNANRELVRRFSLPSDHDTALNLLVVSSVGEASLDFQHPTFCVMLDYNGGSVRQKLQRAGRVARNPFGPNEQKTAHVYMLCTVLHDTLDVGLEEQEMDFFVDFLQKEEDYTVNYESPSQIAASLGDRRVLVSTADASMVDTDSASRQSDLFANREAEMAVQVERFANRSNRNEQRQTLVHARNTFGRKSMQYLAKRRSLNCSSMSSLDSVREEAASKARELYEDSLLSGFSIASANGCMLKEAREKAKVDKEAAEERNEVKALRDLMAVLHPPVLPVYDEPLSFTNVSIDVSPSKEHCQKESSVDLDSILQSRAKVLQATAAVRHKPEEALETVPEIVDIIGRPQSGTRKKPDHAFPVDPTVGG